MRSELKIMSWDSFTDGPWSMASENNFKNGGFDGLTLTPRRGEIFSDLNFLHRLKGIRHFSLNAQTKDDTAAFLVDTLEELTLLTGARNSIPRSTQARLRQLYILDRPSLAIQNNWPELRIIRLGTFSGVDLKVLEGARKLSNVHIDARRQSGTLEGIELCTQITELALVNYSTRDTQPLQNLDNLIQLKLMAAAPTAPHGTINFKDLPGKSLNKIWISNASRLTNLDALAEFPKLREVRLIDCQLDENNRQNINALPRPDRVDIVSTRKN
jgi:hypothetical protein